MMGDGKGRVYAAVRDGHHLTVRSIAAACGITVSTAHHHLKALIAENRIVHVPASYQTNPPPIQQQELS